MSDTLIDLIQAVSGAGPRPATLKPTSLLSTDPDSPGPDLSASAYDPLKTEETTWFPEIPEELRAGSRSLDWPSRPGGALEVLSVKQVRGDRQGFQTFPVAVYTYPVRGNIV